MRLPGKEAESSLIRRTCTPRHVSRDELACRYRAEVLSDDLGVLPGALRRRWEFLLGLGGWTRARVIERRAEVPGDRGRSTLGPG